MSTSNIIPLSHLLAGVESVAATGAPAAFQGDALVLGIGDDWNSSDDFRELDVALQGELRRLIEIDELSTKPLKVTTWLAPKGLNVRTMVLVGLGEVAKRDAGLMFRATAAAAKSIAASKNRMQVAYCGFTGDANMLGSAVMGSLTGCIGQDLFRRERNLFPPSCVTWYHLDGSVVERGTIVARSMNITRCLVNLPPNILFPESFADYVQTLASESGLAFEVWDEKRLETERCGALLGVARGSTRPPRLCILKYAGTDSKLEPIALVGKGVTFDSGGYSLKPTDGMLTMKCDMAGAATVVGILHAAARLRLKQPVVGLIGLVENLVSGDAFKLGDVLTARNGKTIEIHNTDAEGRLVLADVLDVALGYKPARIADFATLTGACVVALGNDIVGSMTNEEAWQQEILESAKHCGEYIWPLPMHSFFSEQISSKVADIKNVGEGRWGGAITAAKFLEEFVGSTPWVHLDIAGPAFLDSPKPWCDAGASGSMVRTFVDLLARR